MTTLLPRIFKLSYNKHSYVIPLNHKVNFLIGQSAIGKSELIVWIETIKRLRKSTYTCSIPSNSIITYVDSNTLRNLSYDDEFIYFIDETSYMMDILSNTNLNSEEERLFIRYMQHSKSIFVFINRDLNVRCPLPQDAVLKIQNSADGFTHKAIPYFPEQKFKFSELSPEIVCEDSNSGCGFIQEYIAELGQVAITSKGINNLQYVLRSYPYSTNIFFDYLSAGHIVYILPNLFKTYDYICNWFSLEYFILECLGHKEEADQILQDNLEYNKEEALAHLLTKYIIYNKKCIWKTSTFCITPQDCNGNVKCPHTSPMSLSLTVKDCILATKEKREKLFKSYADVKIKKGTTSLF